MRRSPFLAAACLAAALVAPAAEAAPKAVSITSPTAGATVSRAAGPLDVTGTALFDAPVATGKTFFLRGTGCGATEDLWLSASKGADDYDGCGVIGGVPLNEVAGAPEVLETRDGMPIRLDASKPVEGTIRAESWLGDGIPGLGLVSVDIALSGETLDGDFADLGTTTVTGTNAGTDGIQVPFTLPVPADLDREALKSMTLEVLVRGIGMNTFNLGLSGDSKLTVPVVDAGVVQVSDTPSFTAAKTVTSFVAADGTWAAELPAPSAGAQTIYARAQQGTTRLSATAVPITVAP